MVIEFHLWRKVMGWGVWLQTCKKHVLTWRSTQSSEEQNTNRNPFFWDENQWWPLVQRIVGIGNKINSGLGQIIKGFIYSSHVTQSGENDRVFASFSLFEKTETFSELVAERLCYRECSQIPPQRQRSRLYLHTWVPESISRPSSVAK